MFPKGPDVHSTLFFHEEKSRLFTTFNYQLTVMEMKPEVLDRVLSHDKPVTSVVYSNTYNHVSENLISLLCHQRCLLYKIPQ